MAQRHTKTIPALLLSSTDDSWGDERERSVMLESYAYVFILATVLLWTMAAVVAWFIPIWVTVTLFVALMIPWIEWQRYTRARGVDANTLAYGGESWKRTAVAGLYFGGCAASMAAAVISRVDSDGGVTGVIVGGAVGAVAAVAIGRWEARRKLRRGDA